MTCCSAQVLVGVGCRAQGLYAGYPTVRQSFHSLSLHVVMHYAACLFEGGEMTCF
jgi:hypothetical protein